MPTISTTLVLSPLPAIEALGQRAAAMGAEVRRDGDQIEVQGAASRVRAGARGDNLSLELIADTDEDLLKIRGLIEAFVTAHGITDIDWKGAKPRKSRLTMARALSCTRISPSFCRVRLAGDFSAFRDGGLHFRLLIAPDGALLPEPGADGDLVWPGGIDAWHRPPYTIRAMSAEADWMDFDIFLHAGGRVTEWTEDLRPGDPVALTGPGGKGIRPARWLGLAGDETALPVILRAIEAADPETQGHASILIAESADIQPVTAPPGLRLEWVLRSEGRSLLDLFRALPTPPETDRFMFFAGERQDAAVAREHAKSLGMTAGEYHCAAYWTEGWTPPLSQKQARR
ncbi:siderophore-interacting protein [Paracoccus caeni]|uniref:Siderophore-interacting protein n=1 Tax=Paracoccus caeni TaxID=657651 RepID=A0A934SBW0_9RHOB|nr:siderophore-interacting protein [Paracoccus caeni]MBK4215961.1 siderophore-interacting protein [Paracoccus caeni]